MHRINIAHGLFLGEKPVYKAKCHSIDPFYEYMNEREKK